VIDCSLAACVVAPAGRHAILASAAGRPPEGRSSWPCSVAHPLGPAIELRRGHRGKRLPDVVGDAQEPLAQLPFSLHLWPPEAAGSGPSAIHPVHWPHRLIIRIPVDRWFFAVGQARIAMEPEEQHWVQRLIVGVRSGTLPVPVVERTEALQLGRIGRCGVGPVAGSFLARSRPFSAAAEGSQPMAATLPATQTAGPGRSHR